MAGCKFSSVVDLTHHIQTRSRVRIIIALVYKSIAAEYPQLLTCSKIEGTPNAVLVNMMPWSHSTIHFITDPVQEPHDILH